MQSTISRFKSTIRRHLRLTLATALAALVGFTVLVADTVTKQREATTEVILELHQKGPGGAWRVIDRAKGPANFTASIAEIASGKELTTGHNWTARSEKGRTINVRLAGPAKVRLDVTSGLLQLDAPFDVTVDGKKFRLNQKLSTESASAPVGQISGKKAQVNVSERSLTAEVAGFSSIRQPDMVERLLHVSEAKKASAETSGKKPDIRSPFTATSSAGIADELIIVVKGSGKVVAK
ncbi:MAG TPA: hypothetical protein VFD58_19600 [Blastocatellia bacterium]|nr:hypothetical protein [Blastocatellia bacterium]